MRDNHDYPRCLFIRYLRQGISTPETRAEGLEVLSAFLRDRNYSKYPPAAITTMDITNMENPQSLDQFFMDNDIVEFFTTEFDADDLTTDFFIQFPVLASQL